MQSLQSAQSMQPGQPSMRRSAVILSLGLFLSVGSLANELEPREVLFWSPSQQLYGYKNIDLIGSTRPIRRGETAYPLPLEASQELRDLEFEHADMSWTLSSYMADENIAGLLVVKAGKILFEEYALGNGPTSRWISFSVAKSVSSMLLGAAIKDGYIRSVEDPVTDYLPQLRGSAYGESTLQDVLQMASGVSWDEDYTNPESDVAIAGGYNALTLYNYLDDLEVAAEPGEVFNYNTGESNLVGGIVRAAVGNNLATYAEQKIWQAFGMEHDASWSIDDDHGVELGGCCINATLRDYARIGLFALRGGRLPDGTEVLPRNWMAHSTAPSNGYEGYGYLWWLFDDDAYAALGIFGQMIWIDPKEDLIIVTHGAWPQATAQTHSRARMAMVDAVTKALAN